MTAPTGTSPSAPPAAGGTQAAASNLIASDAGKPRESETAALVQVARYTAYESMDASPLKTANKDRTLATVNPALDDPHLPKNRDFSGKTETQTQHILACALIYHASAWYHDHGGIDPVVHQLDAPTLMKLCYDEGTFSA